MKSNKDYALEAYEEVVATLPPCPTAIAVRVGAKVAWHTYATMAEAKVASLYAAARSAYYECLGYEFGYSSPGEITELRDGTGFVVTFP